VVNNNIIVKRQDLILSVNAVPFVVVGVVHSSAVLHVVLKNSPLKPELDTVIKKKRKGNSGVVQTNDDEGTLEDDISVVDVKPTPRGTTAAHLIKFINELLNIMDEDESLMGDG